MIDKLIITKAVIWRVISLLIGFLITLIYLGEVKASIELVVLVNIILTVAHYFFEVAWERRIHGSERDR